MKNDCEEGEVPAKEICTESNADFFIDFKFTRRFPRFDTMLYHHPKFGYAIRPTVLAGMVYDVSYDKAMEEHTHSCLVRCIHVCLSSHASLSALAHTQVCLAVPASQILVGLSEDYYPDERFMELPIWKHGHYARFLSLRESAKLIEFIPDELPSHDHIRYHFSEVLYMEASKHR